MLLVGNRDLGESGDFSEKSTEDMQQQQQQGGVGGGGPPFGAPAAEIAPFPSSSSGTHVLGFSTPDFHHHHNLPPEAASPISSRPPALSQHQSFEELVPDEQALAAGEGSAPGNRWPRQETLALLKIRSEMDGAFRDATLKGPLWDDVSRKLAELGYTRSAKKCKEKFENVHKYYKRTKEGRAGRQDGKAYRFFNQLEALGGATTITMPDPATTTTAAATISASTLLAISGTSTAGPSCSAGVQTVQPPAFFIPPRPPAPAPDVAPIPGLSSLGFSSDTFSTSSYDSDDEGTEEVAASVAEGRKRKRAVGSGGSRKMMSFFEGMMKQVIERQEAMQQRFLETIEKREQDRMIREEAWKRQEMARLNREHELLAQERAMAASRDAAIISFLQKMSGGQTIQPPPAVTVTVPAAPPPPVTPNPPPPQTQPPPQPKTEQYCPKSQPSSPLPTPTPPPPPPQQQHQTSQQQELPSLHHNQSTENIRQQQQTPPPPALTKPPQASSTAPVPVTEPHEVVGGGGTSEGPSVSSSRWPKSEVHALIKLRSGLESRYQEAGPKGPLWEEISAGMQRLGYNRSSKRCKEKWENINKYFKKVKESNKKRPEDAKTCPYFHQLDALYRKKAATAVGGSGGGLFSNQRPLEIEPIPNPIPQQQRSADTPISSSVPPPALVSAPAPAAPQPSSQPPHPQGADSKNNSNNNGSGSIQVPTSNGGLPQSFFEQGTSGGAAMKKPEDIMNELMDHQKQAGIDDYDKMEEHDSDNLDDEDEDDDDEEDRKMQYKIQFQPQNVNVSGGGNGTGSGGSSSAAAKATGSFLAMVQ